MSLDSISFNRITFALPVQPFKVVSFVSAQERLPAVTEFVLRLLHTCGAVTLAGFRDYFGFSEAEALSVIESLDRQGYVALSDENLTLSEEMRQRFETSPDDYPWVTKLKRRSDIVPFDLLTFSALGRAEFAFATANWVKLNPPSEVLGNSLEKARSAYRENFAQIERESARDRGEGREKSFGLHSIETIEARRPGFVPLTVSFEVDAQNSLSVKIPNEFEAGASPELVSEFRDRVAASVEAISDSRKSGLQDFLDLFELDFLRTFTLQEELDVHKLALEVARGLAAPTGIRPLFGASYLKRNRDIILNEIFLARGGRKDQTSHQSSLAWVAPDYSLWGRGEDFRQSIEAFRKALASVGKGDELYLFDRAEERQESQVKSRYAGTGLVELHLVRPSFERTAALRSAMELMLYPGQFAAAIFHASLPSMPGARVPIGFISTQPKHLRTVHQLILESGNGSRYGGRWSPNREGGDKRSNTFFQGCSFLAYSPIQVPSAS